VKRMLTVLAIAGAVAACGSSRGGAAGSVPACLDSAWARFCPPSSTVPACDELQWASYQAELDPSSVPSDVLSQLRDACDRNESLPASH
jgi:hypothetical protein